MVKDVHRLPSCFSFWDTSHVKSPENPYLGENYLKCLDVILLHQGEDIQVILGTSVDKWKLTASLTLFDQATSDEYGENQIKSCLIEFNDGKKCRKTSKILTSFRERALSNLSVT